MNTIKKIYTSVHEIDEHWQLLYIDTIIPITTEQKFKVNGRLFSYVKSEYMVIDGVMQLYIFVKADLK